MRHLKKGRKFGRTADQRRALFRTMLGELIIRERLRTTEAKAKALRPMAEKLVTVAKRNTLHARRLLSQRLSAEAARKLANVIAPGLHNRHGGYTRVVRLQRRPSDASRMAIIEFVQ